MDVQLKLRVANGIHTAMVYLMALSGLRKTDGCIGHPLLLPCVGPLHRIASNSIASRSASLAPQRIAQRFAAGTTILPPYMRGAGSAHPRHRTCAAHALHMPRYVEQLFERDVVAACAELGISRLQISPVFAEWLQRLQHPYFGLECRFARHEYPSLSAPHPPPLTRRHSPSAPHPLPLT